VGGGAVGVDGTALLEFDGFFCRAIRVPWGSDTPARLAAMKIFRDGVTGSSRA